LSRRPLKTADYLNLIGLSQSAAASSAANQISYQQITFDDKSKDKLIKLLDKANINYFYLALPPQVVPGVIDFLLDIKAKQPIKCRFLIEKPFGFDLDSAILLQNKIAKAKLTNRLYLSDHYLFKKEVLNLKSKPKKRLSITALEKVGLANRISYYDKIGALKDMVQNHFLNIAFKLIPSLTSADQLKLFEYKKGQYQSYVKELGRPSQTETAVYLNLQLAGIKTTFLTAKKTAVKQTTVTVDGQTYQITDQNPYNRLFTAFFNRQHRLFPTIKQTILAWQIINKIKQKPATLIIYPANATKTRLLQTLQAQPN
ncbi:MAG: hypothetical protein GXP43_02810, partial [bacterium]|nr:hypothetical protein [bacterium]